MVLEARQKWNFRSVKNNSGKEKISDNRMKDDSRYKILEYLSEHGFYTKLFASKGFDNSNLKELVEEGLISSDNKEFPTYKITLKGKKFLKESEKLLAETWLSKNQVRLYWFLFAVFMVTSAITIYEFCSKPKTHSKELKHKKEQKRKILNDSLNISSGKK